MCPAPGASPQSIGSIVPVRKVLLVCWRPVSVVAWLVVVGVLTLSPVDASSAYAGGLADLCLICGSRGSADALLNVVLFLPLGVLVASVGRGVGLALTTGFLLSGLIEFSQISLSGRHAGVADLVWNTLGAAAGVVVWSVLAKRVSGPDRRALVSVSAGLALSLVLAGALLIPRPTQRDYWGQRAPDLGHMPEYDGEVVEASLSGREFPAGRLPTPGPHDVLLEPPWSLDGVIRVGARPRAVSPILSIYDAEQDEVLLLGAHGSDLVFRERRVASALRFDAPDIRIPDAFAGYAPGDTVSIGASRSDGLCLRIGSVFACDLGVTPGRTWSLLLYLEGVSERVRTLLDHVWLAALFWPVGFLAGSRREALVASGALTGAMLLAAGMSPLLLPPPGELVACAAGVACGWLIRDLLMWLGRAEGRTV